MRLVDESNKRLKIGLNVAVLLVALISVTRRDGVLEQTTAFENLMIDSFAPMQRSVTYVQDNISSLTQNYIANLSASKDNVKLKRKLAEMEQAIFAFEEVERENKRLKKLLEFVGEIPSKKVLAQVVAWDASSDFKVLRINKGIDDGIKLQSTVVTSEGLVGYVYRLTNHFADILTILDPNNRVDGIIERIRSHGIVEGYSTDRCLMKYVTRTEPIILNDVVLTSGLGNIYPKGVKIGVVSRIERESYGITQHVEITPAVDFGKLEEVAVLVSEENSQKQKEWAALDEQDDSKEEGK